MKKSKIKNLILIGLDGAIPTLVRNLAEKGELPNFRRLLNEGVFAENALPCFPTITPPNWATLSTGAWPGTHGVTGYSIRYPGEPPNVNHWGFSSKECLAEFIWDVAERAGKRCVLIKYPGSWPPTLRRGAVIDGCGPDRCIHEIGGDSLFTTMEGYPFADQLELAPASNWKSQPESAIPPIEGVVTLRPKKFRLIEGLGSTLVNGDFLFTDDFSAKIYQILIIASSGKGYDQIIISRSKDAKDPIATLSIGQWSDWIFDDFEYKHAEIKGSFRFKLMELSEDGKRVRLYATQILPINETAYPKGVGEEITEKVGPFIQRPGTQGSLMGWIDDVTYVELMEQQNEWFAKAARYFMKEKEFFIYLQSHTLDHAQHVFLSVQKKFDLLVRVYQSVDHMVGQIVQGVNPDETLIVVVSDHGSVPVARPWDEQLREMYLGRMMLQRAKVLHIEEGVKDVYENIATKRPRVPTITEILAEAGVLLFKMEKGRQVIDLERTKAFPSAGYIWINLKGREPKGIVEPGKEYEEVRDEILQALYDARAPDGKRLHLLVLKKEDARILGLYGERVGDIVYAVGEHHIDEHGLQLPTFQHGIGTMKALLIFKGPCIRKGFTLKRMIWLTDVVPTICYFIGLRPPKNVEGAVLHDILSDGS